MNIKEDFIKKKGKICMSIETTKKYEKAIDEEDWYTIEKIQKEYKKLK